MSVYYEYGLSIGYGHFTPTNTIASSLSTTQPVPIAISGLASGTTIHFQLVVANSLGTVTGGDQNFKTASNPIVVTEAATNIGATNATVNGAINPNSSPSTWYVEYGTSLSYGSFTPTNALAAGTISITVSNEITNLAPATVYHYQLVGANSSGTNFGGDMTFTNAAAAPSVTTLAASSISASSATLNASVNPNGAETSA